jgi:molybdate transport system regulatory protein
MDLRANCKLWCYAEDRAGVYGDGKQHLLAAVAQHGSLQAAAAALGISYRKAWGDVRKAESCLGLRLLVRNRGGSAGGGSQLTPAAEHLLVAYRRFQNAVLLQLEQAAQTLNQEIAACIASAPS